VPDLDPTGHPDDVPNQVHSPTLCTLHPRWPRPWRTEGPREVTVDSVPFGEVEVHRGLTVCATDGEIGQVQGLVVEPGGHHVTHVLLQEGHMWGRKDLAARGSIG
jgi:hypothetical protein